jgi:hypothetical protein
MRRIRTLEKKGL